MLNKIKKLLSKGEEEKKGKKYLKHHKLDIGEKEKEEKNPRFKSKSIKEKDDIYVHDRED